MGCVCLCVCTLFFLTVGYGRYVRSLDHLLRIGTRQIVAYGAFLTSASFLVNMTNAACLLLGGIKCLRGEITAEQLTTFLFYTQFVVESALASSEQVANINTAVGSSERVLMLLRRQPNAHLLKEEEGGGKEGRGEDRQLALAEGAEGRGAGKLKLGDFKGNLEFRGVSFAYPYIDKLDAGDDGGEGDSSASFESYAEAEEGGDRGSTEASQRKQREPGQEGGEGKERRGQQLTLSNINLTLKPGTVTALVGPSGGGKSTLVALLQVR